MVVTSVLSEPTSGSGSLTSIRLIIQAACNHGATAVYLQVGRFPYYRIGGKLLPQDYLAAVTPDQFGYYMTELLNPSQLQQYLTQRKLEVNVRIPGFMQARMHCGPTTQGSEAMSLNAISLDGPSREILHAGTIQAMVEDAHRLKASDLHLQVGEVPHFRIQGKLVPQESYGTVTPRQFEDFLQEVLTPVQYEQFQTRMELDTAILYEGVVRCRVNCSQALRGGSMVVRLISLEVPTLKKLGLPRVLGQLVQERQGLILVTGSVNSGKSTTLAAMLRYLNDLTPRKIVTIEDPIEYVHSSNQCLFMQREVGLHTQDFKEALRASLRQDPDVILIGEMRDRETVDTALRASLTGHLVLATLHTKGAVNAFNRLVNFYHPDEQEVVRIQILEALRAVIAQVLVPTIQGGRTAALEIMLNTDAIRDYLQKGCLEEIYQLIEEGKEESQTMNQALFDLYQEGVVDPAEALAVSLNPEDLAYMMKNYTRRSSRSGLMTADYINSRQL